MQVTTIGRDRMRISPDGIDVFIGLDVGNGVHHPAAPDRQGQLVLNQALPE